MTSVTFIHTSDFQIGMTRKFLSPEAQSRFDDARLRSIATLGDLALEHAAEFIVVAGDVFEHNSLEPKTLLRALETLRKLPVPVYLLPGNHDPLVADSIFRRTEDIENVTVLGAAGFTGPVVVRDGVEVVGAPLMSKYASEDLCARAIRELGPTDAIRVLVGHGQVEGYGAEDNPALIDLPGLECALENRVVDYVALGDTHSTQSLGASERVWFSGSPETTDYFEPPSGGETDSGNALVVTISKDADSSKVDVVRVPTGAWTFEALKWEVSGEDDVDSLLAQLRAYPEKDRTVVKYSITGTLGLEATAKLERGLAELEPVFAALYPRKRLMNLHLEPSEEELENLPLTGYAREAMQELVAAASAGGAAGAGAGAGSGDATARDAVNLLFRLSKEGK